MAWRTWLRDKKWSPPSFDYHSCCSGGYRCWTIRLAGTNTWLHPVGELCRRGTAFVALSLVQYRRCLCLRVVA
eukprot:359718-Chlamydomonas_euryale.AAC.9